MKNRKLKFIYQDLDKNSGVTLIALVVTIIVLIILASVSITALVSDNSIIGNANKAKIEARGASVEEARDLWNIQNEETGDSKPLTRLLDELIEVNLISADEKDKILNSHPHHIVIGSRNIVFDENSTEEVEIPKVPINNDPCVGYYADFENEKGEKIPDGIVDGIIFADMSTGTIKDTQRWAGSNISTYFIPVVKDKSKLKKYYIQDEKKIDERWSTEPNKLISPISGSGELDRFYVMSIENMDDINHTWYLNARNLMNDNYTVTDFGKGKENTKKMIERSKVPNGSIPEGYPNAGTLPYGSVDTNDIWYSSILREKSMNGWFVPSALEWSAFVNELDINNNSKDKNYYGKHKLEEYWTSSQYVNYAAYYPDFNYDFMYFALVDGKMKVRLANTF